VRRKDGVVGLLLAGAARLSGDRFDQLEHKGRGIRRGEEARARDKLEGIVVTR
jgi:hypothetical protein